jgi:hypothetical protein
MILERHIEPERIGGIDTTLVSPDSPNSINVAVMHHKDRIVG